MNVGELNQLADKSYDISVAKKNALERAKSRQIIAYNEHLFVADPQTICLVKTLSENKNYLSGLNIFKGAITYRGVSDAFKLNYCPPEEVIV